MPLHCHKPDILVLTRTNLNNLRRRPWLNDLLKNYKSWSSPSATGGTMVCVRNELTVLNLTSLIEMDTNGLLVAVKIDAQNTPLLLLGTYWPSGSSVEALRLRKELQAQIAHLIGNNSQAVPIVLGDMSATLNNDERSSCLRYPADVMYRQFVAESQSSPIDAKHGEIQELNPLRQWTHQQATANSGKNLSTQYKYSRIDDILLPAKIPSRVAFISKCYLGYQSDHIPLYTTITTDILDCQFLRPQTSQPMNGTKTKLLHVRSLKLINYLSRMPFLIQHTDCYKN